MVYFASAHYDERAFADPFRFDIARSPNDHLAFGDGPHLCLGAQCGRLQLRTFFAECPGVLPGVHLDGEPRQLASDFINGITRLPLRWEV